MKGQGVNQPFGAGTRYKKNAKDGTNSRIKRGMVSERSKELDC